MTKKLLQITIEKIRKLRRKKTMRSKQQCKKSASHITTKIPHPENNQPFEKPPGGKHLPHIHRHT